MSQHFLFFDFFKSWLFSMQPYESELHFVQLQRQQL